MNNLFLRPAASVLANLRLLHKFLLLGIILALPTLVAASLVYLDNSGQIVLPQLARYGLWLALFSTVIGLYLLASLYLNTAQAINMLSVAIARFAKGDLSARAKLDSRDEFGQAAEGFNAMAKAIKVIIADVSSQAVNVSGAVTELSQQTSQIASSSQQQSEAAQTMASAVEEVTASIAQVAAQTTDTEAVSQRASDLSSQGTAVVEQAAAEMHRISDVFQQSSAQLEVLGEQTQEISTIAQLIKEIADQTNLLALNAAIEAARAGEQGRGFAVVADEVRSLAEKTAGATSEITSTISAIQQNMSKATDSMHAGADQVRSGMHLAQQAGSALQDINQGSQEALTKVHEIADAMNAQSDASHHIAENVEHISVMTRENSQSLQQISSAAAQLDTSSQQLREAISAFSGGTAEDAKKLVEKAARLVQQNGEQAAFVRINDPFGDLVVRDLYIFAYNLKGEVLAHGGNPALVGKNMHDAQDPQGKHFVRERIAIAEGTGEGWQDYMFRNPETGEQEEKTSYILRVNDLILGCGVYK